MRPTDISSHRNYRPFGRALAGDGGGTHDGGMEARLAKLEASMEHVQEDIRDIKTDIREVRSSLRADLLWMIGGFAAMLAVMAHGFHWI